MPATGGCFDELRGFTPGSTDIAANNVADQPYFTPAWATFFDSLGVTGFQQLDQRVADLEQQIHNNGVTYNVYSDADGVNGPQRPWALDLFPCLLTPKDWQSIEKGVIQRARVLEGMMADVYGPQELLKRALLPAALTQGHPGYLRAMHGARPVGGKFLHIAAFDLARAPNGQWWVVSQRTQAPSGLGYLLENRTIISRLFPQAFKNLHVRQLASTYKSLVDNMRQMSPAGANAHIALLTPGPYNETYFEHAYLARSLGLTLVEGNDLTVRNQKLYLKTLHGLEPIHGLLKRLDDEFLDPLELRADSSLGVPGILQAIRAGNVLMANAPGSAFLESPALLGFMPGIADYVIGETFSLPALPTWWCGERAALAAVLPRLDNSVIKPSYPGYSNPGNFEAVLGRNMSANERDAWAGRMLRHGNAYTVQRHLPMSQLPTWENDQIMPKSAMLRVFAVADGVDSWQVLPGGLTRIAHGVEAISMQRGGSSADVWVSADAASALQPSFPVSKPSNFSSKRVVTSRAAENLFWLGRYSERTEGTLHAAQLILNHLHRKQRGASNVSESTDPAESSLEPLHRWFYALAVQHALILPSVPSLLQSPRVFERSLIAALSQTDLACSVGFNLRSLKNAAFCVRERLSQEQWNLIVQSEQQFFATSEALLQQGLYQAQDTLDLLSATSVTLAAITGAQTDRMARDDGWRLLSVGRLIERLIFLSSSLMSGFEEGSLAFHTDAFGSSNQEAYEDTPDGYETIISLFDSTVTFHAQHHGRDDLAALLESLVLDRDNPRSLAWVVHTLRGRLAKLEGDGPLENCTLSKMLPNPKHWQLQDILALDHQHTPAHLLTLLEACILGANQVARAIGEQYFNHTHVTAQSLGA
ncbi:MAG: circularly permuted type 2 ATP-grasp protein [Burkholderiaceae bacterium]